MSEWTKTPPNEDGIYWVIPKNWFVSTLAITRDEAVMLLGSPSLLSRDHVDLWWTGEVAAPPLPTNTNTPDQAGA